MKRLFLTIALCLITVPAWAISFVQVKALSTNVTSATTIAVTMDSNVTSGNLLAVGMRANPPDVTLACSDSLGTSYTLVQESYNASVGNFGMCYGIAPSTGANTVTITFGASSTYRGVCVAEYSGVRTTNPVEASQSNTQLTDVTTDFVTSGNVTVTAGTAIFGWSEINNVSGSYTVGTNYTSRAHDNANTATADFMCEDRLVVTPGSQAATWTTSDEDGQTYSGALVMVPAGGRKRAPVVFQ